MKLEMFLEKFEQFADAPNAVAKMRELVVDLAVSGKLVPNDPKENPVRLNMSGDPADSAIPPNWQSGILGDAITLEYGDNLPAGKRSSSGEYPVYGSNGIVGTHDSYLTKEPAIIVGRKGSAGALNIANGPSWTTDVAYFVCPPSELDLRYTYYLLVSLRLDVLGKGIKPGLSRKEAYVLPIALPPLAEQKRIVAKVDELMALCDRLEAQQQERDSRHAALARASLARFAEAPTPANLDFLFHNSYTTTPADLRKSILTLAVQGKFVPQDPDDESVQNSFLGLTPLPFESNDSIDIPVQWKLCTYRSLTSLVTSGSRGWKEFYSEAGAIFVRTQNIKTDKLNLDDVAFVDLPKSAEGMRAQVLQDDILITITGANVTKAARVEKQIPEAYVSQHIALTRPRWPEMSKWLHLCFISHGSARGTLEQLAYGDKPGLNLNNIRDLVLPIPPLAEQRRIVAKVDQLMALVDQLEAQLAEARSKSAALLEAVVHELLHPSAEIIDLASYRAAIGCYTIRKMSWQPYFGRTAAMKSLYLAEAHVGLNLGFQPEREAAGPLDLWLYSFEEEGKQKGWFEAVVENTSNGKTKVEYQPGKMLAAQAAQAESQLAREQRKEFDRMLGLLSDKKTEEVELIATLFAAWNDFLLDGHVPSDDEIVTEVRENWHAKKERFTPAQLRQWLGWLRQNNLVPQGRLPHTVHQSKLSLS